VATQQIWSIWCNFLFQTTNHILATGLLKNWEFDETYDRVPISAEEKFLTVSMATFRDNKQALYGIFQYVLTSSNSPQNSITISVQAELLWTLETAKEAKVDTLIFTAHTHCFKLKRNLLTGKLPDIKAFLKLFNRH